VEINYPKRVNELVKNIEIRARNSDVLMIWTDCDREGEHIGFEIAEVCRKVNRRITVERARFSAIIPQYVPVIFITNATGLNLYKGKFTTQHRIL
jgi:DNA topoisomerase IA